MKIAVTGTFEGSLEKLYQQIKQQEELKEIKVDLVLITGNFLAIRNKNDLKCVDCLEYWKNLGDFHDYYLGKLKATHLTLVCGGNLEASNYFKTLPYGGWIAPSIYYMGYSNVIKFNGLRIGAISGTNDKFYEHFYKTDITKTGYFERLPLDNKEKRSICYTRFLDCYRMLKVKENLDIIVTFDWPLDVLGDKQNTIDCLKKVPFAFQNGELFNDLGSEMYKQVLDQVKPKHWFAGKVNISLNQTYKHKLTDEQLKLNKNKETEFHSLNKFMIQTPKRSKIAIKGLEIFDIKSSSLYKSGLEYDLEWLTILKETNQYISIEKDSLIKLPELTDENASIQHDNSDLKESIKATFKENYTIPDNFSRCAPVKSSFRKDENPKRTKNFVNKQTTAFCKLLQLTDPNQLIVDQIKFNSKKDKLTVRLVDWVSNIICKGCQSKKKLNDN